MPDAAVTAGALLAALAAVAAQASSAPAAWPPSPPSPPPNILFLLVDDLGWAGVGFNSPTGEPQTPTIDRLAAEGAVLERHYTYRVCSPTRSSFLSGRLPIHVNQFNFETCERGGGVPLGMTSIASMLGRAGYVSHHAGKWHGGMSRPENLPINRGFASSLAMLAGAADHWTNSRSCGGSRFVDLWLDHKPAHGIAGAYSLYAYVAHAVDVVKKHDKTKPLFMYMAFQNVHGPTQAPQCFIDKYDAAIFKSRRQGLGQVSAVDEGIANLTAAWKAAGLWDNTLVVFSSDNGGPLDHESNYPLRGHKGTDFEGGVRTVAFVSGGWLPAKMRGGRISGMMHIADWYATFASLAGVDPTDHDAAKQKLPPIDSIDMSPMILGTTAVGLRSELPLSFVPESGTSALISEPYKLILTSRIDGGFPGPTTPNGTDPAQFVDCSSGCLFDLSTDATEHVDLAPRWPHLVAKLRRRLEAIGEGVFQSPGERVVDKKAVQAARELHGGFWGPWEETSDGLQFPAATPSGTQPSPTDAGSLVFT